MKGGGIRPIAVGHTLRRLPAKCAGNQVIQSTSAYLAPWQLGYGTSHGAEAAAHASRLFLYSIPPDHVLLKVGLRNAFNSQRHDKMLEAVKKIVLEQGDPLNLLLFCLTMHPLVRCLS